MRWEYTAKVPFGYRTQRPTDTSMGHVRRVVSQLLLPGCYCSMSRVHVTAPGLACEGRASDKFGKHWLCMIGRLLQQHHDLPVNPSSFLLMSVYFLQWMEMLRLFPVSIYRSREDVAVWCLLSCDKRSGLYSYAAVDRRCC